MLTTVWSTEQRRTYERHTVVWRECRRGWWRIHESLPVELIPEKQNQMEWERERQSPGFWQPSMGHKLTSDFSLKSQQKHLSSKRCYPLMMFYNKGHIGWKNSAPEKTLGSTYPRDQDSKGLDYAPPVAQWKTNVPIIIPSLSCWTTEPRPQPWPFLLAILGVESIASCLLGKRLSTQSFMHARTHVCMYLYTVLLAWSC